MSKQIETTTSAGKGKHRRDERGRGGHREDSLRLKVEQVDSRSDRKRRWRLWGKPIEVDYTPWQETVLDLSPERIAVAEMLFYTTLVRKTKKDARKKRSLRTIEPDGSVYRADKRKIRRRKDKKQYVKGLLNAYEVGDLIASGERDSLGRTQVEYAQRIKEMKLDEERSKIYAYVGSLSESDFEDSQKKVRRKTEAFINRVFSPLSKDQKNFMELHTGITPKEALRGWIITGGFTLLTLAVLEGGSFLGGRETVKHDLVESLNKTLLDFDLKFDLRTALLAASYLIWTTGVIASTIGNYKLLKETGYSTNILSKGLYDYVSARTDSGTIKYIASAIGYATKDLVAEAPWIAAVLIAPQVSSVTTDESIDFLIGANLTAGVLEGGLGVGTLIGAKRRRRRREMLSSQGQTKNIISSNDLDYLPKSPLQTP